MFNTSYLRFQVILLVKLGLLTDPKPTFGYTVKMYKTSNLGLELLG